MRRAEATNQFRLSPSPNRVGTEVYDYTPPEVGPYRTSISRTTLELQAVEAMGVYPLLSKILQIQTQASQRDLAYSWLTIFF